MYDQEMHFPQLPAPMQRLFLNWYFQGCVAVISAVLAGIRMMFPDAAAQPNYGIGALILFAANLLVVDMTLAYFGRLRTAKIVGYIAAGTAVFGMILGLIWVLR